MKNPDEYSQQPTASGDRDLTELLHLHPAQAFLRPQAVVDDAGLTLDEKRAILAAWASDACAVEAAPVLRRAPGCALAVSVDEILEALQSLDRQFAKAAAPSRRRQMRRASVEAFRQRRGGEAGRSPGRPAG